jgi:hypothetical protein
MSDKKRSPFKVQEKKKRFFGSNFVRRLPAPTPSRCCDFFRRKFWRQYRRSKNMFLLFVRIIKIMSFQRPILNFAPRGKLWLPWESLSPRGEFCPLVVKLSPGGEIICLPLHSFKQYGVSTPGGERRGEHFPYGTNFPLETRGEVKSGPLNHLNVPR